MPRRTSKKPTDGELDILHVLWKHGPRTARKLGQELKPKVSNQAINTRLNIMADKGFIRIDAKDWPPTYHAAVTRAAIRTLVLKDLANRLFDGSVKKIAMHLIKPEKASESELKEIDKIVEDLDNRD